MSSRVMVTETDRVPEAVVTVGRHEFEPHPDALGSGYLGGVPDPPVETAGTSVQAVRAVVDGQLILLSVQDKPPRSMRFA